MGLVANRARQLATTSGTGTFSVNGAVDTGWLALSTALQNEQGAGPWTVDYVAVNPDGSQWEVVRGATLTAGSPDTLTRGTVEVNHLGGAAKVNFTAPPIIGIEPGASVLNLVVLADGSRTITGPLTLQGNGNSTGMLRVIKTSDSDTEPAVSIESGGSVVRTVLLDLFDEGGSVSNEAVLQISHAPSSQGGTRTPGAQIYSKGLGASGAALKLESTSDDLGTFNLNALVIAANGRVGVGTDAPSSDLEVSGSAQVGTAGIGETPTSSIPLRVLHDAANDLGDILINPGGAGNQDFVGLQATQSGNNTTKLHLGRKFTSQSAFLPQLTVDSNGQVGIGTSSPAKTLDVVGTLGVTGGVTLGSPTGGSKGAGTLNASGLYVGGVAVKTQGAVVEYAQKSDTQTITAGAGQTTINGLTLSINVPSSGSFKIAVRASISIGQATGAANLCALVLSEGGVQKSKKFFAGATDSETREVTLMHVNTSPTNGSTYTYTVSAGATGVNAQITTVGGYTSETIAELIPV